MKEEKPTINIFTNEIQSLKVQIDNNLGDISIGFWANHPQANTGQCAALVSKTLSSTPLGFIAKPPRYPSSKQQIEIKGLCPNITVKITLPKEMLIVNPHVDNSADEVSQEFQNLSHKEHNKSYDAPMEGNQFDI